MISYIGFISKVSNCVVVDMLLVANIEIINPCFCGFLVAWDTFVLIVRKSVRAATNVQLCVIYTVNVSKLI